MPKPLQKPDPPVQQTVRTPVSSERAGRLDVGLLAATPLATLESIRVQIAAHDRGLEVCEGAAGAGLWFGSWDSSVSRV